MVRLLFIGILFSLIFQGCMWRDWNIPPRRSTVTDNRDGNQYEIFRIGSQVWFKENLRYKGDFFDGTNPDDWYQSWRLKRATFSYPEGNVQLQTDQGLVYNWYAVTSDKICPPGWRVPNNSDWDELTEYLGGRLVAGGKMKTVEGWAEPNVGGTNESGFSAIPVSFRDAVGNFDTFFPNTRASFWSVDEADPAKDYVWLYSLFASGAGFGKIDNAKNSGVSCRCIKK